MKKLIQLTNDHRVTPLILAFLVLMSYALFIPAMGYFMDDWYLIWFKHIFGASQYPAYFSVDRPLMGYFYVLANFILANTESAVIWQLFGLVTRWLCVYALWGFLSTLWPNAKRQNILVAILAAVFPGFSQQWIAVIYSFFFTCLAGFFFSLTLMLKAVRTPKRFWVYMLGSLLIGFYSYAAAEFYFGLELIRPVVLWIEFSRVLPTFRARLLRTVKNYLVFGFVYLGYAIWRTFFFVSVNHDVMLTENLKNNFLKVIIDLLQKVYQAGVDSVVNAWVNPLNLKNYPTNGFTPILIFGIVIVTSAVLGIWLLRIIKGDPIFKNNEDKRWTAEAFGLALISLVVAVIPFWGAALPIDYLYPYDRFLLAYLFGSCLMLVVFLHKSKPGILLIVFLVAVAAGYQINTSIRYKNQWIQQRDFFWQLTWRVPVLEKDTLLITEDLPFSKYFSAPSLTAPLNMIYEPDLNSKEIPYLIVLNSQQKEVVKTYSPNLTVEFDFRSFEFQGNTSSMVVFKKPSDGCLQIVTPTDSPYAYAKKNDFEFWQSSVPFSNLNRIIDDPDQQSIPPLRFFGNENRNQWCFYFEKADLARQNQQWQEIIQYYKDAEKAGFGPQIDSEWIPLLEAYIKTNQMDEALAITKNITNHDVSNTAGFCQKWQQLSIDEGTMSSYSSESLAWLKCGVPYE